MKDIDSYALDVFSYWRLEYPGKFIGNGEARALISNCHYLGWSVPRCCARINEMYFSDKAANGTGFHGNR